jgi:HSP20 family molecular chaperone IbpA
MLKLLFQKLVVVYLAGGLVLAGSYSWAEEETAQLKQQVAALQNQVNQLQAELANRQQGMGSQGIGPQGAGQQGVGPQGIGPQGTGPGMMGNGFGQGEDSFAQMEQMQRLMERNMRQDFAGTGTFNPRMDMRPTDNAYIITMDIPGMDKDKINVETKDGTLVISGERKSEMENTKGNQYYRHERSFGAFMQAIPLPEDAQKDHIDANYKNGVLTVTIGREKKAENKSQGSKITVK